MGETPGGIRRQRTLPRSVSMLRRLRRARGSRKRRLRPRPRRPRTRRVRTPRPERVERRGHRNRPGHGRMTALLLLMNGRFIPQCLASYERLDTDLALLTGYWEHELVDVIASVIDQTSYDFYVLSSD